MPCGFIAPACVPCRSDNPLIDPTRPSRPALRRPRRFVHASLQDGHVKAEKKGHCRSGYADLSSLPRVAPKLRVATNVEGGRGLVVRDGEEVEAFEVIARIPIESALVVCFEDALTDSAVDDYPFPEDSWVSLAYWCAADWDLKLCALLLYHALHADHGGPWAAYVNSLPSPEQLVTAADLDDEALEDLQYPPMVDAVEVYQYRVATEYTRLLRALPVRMRERVSRKRFEWAMKIVHSRAFSIPPGGFAASSTRAGLRGVGRPGPEWPRKFALVPVLDMTNHGSGENLARFRYDDREAQFELVAGVRGYDGGGQVLVSYGELTNDDLYLLYGFVQAGNPNDVYEVEDVTDWVAEHVSMREWNLFDAKLRLLERVGLCYEGRKFHLGRCRIDPDLVAALRILLASAEEFRMARAAVQIEPARDTLSVAGIKRVVPGEWYKPISEGNERMVWSRIECQCKRLLAEFPTSIELDEEMIILHAASSIPIDKTTSTPLLFRVEKKRILREAAMLATEQRIKLELETDLFENSEFAPPNADLWSDVL